MAEAMFEPGRVYTKCGVILEGLEPESRAQQDLFSIPDPRAPALLAAMDGLNSRFGRQTLRLGSEGLGQKSYDTKRAFKTRPGQPGSIRFRLHGDVGSYRFPIANNTIARDMANRDNQIAIWP